MGVDILEIAADAEGRGGAAAARLADEILDLILRVDLDGHALGLERVGDLLRRVVGAEDGELLRVEVPDAPGVPVQLLVWRFVCLAGAEIYDLLCVVEVRKHGADVYGSLHRR